MKDSYSTVKLKGSMAEEWTKVNAEGETFSFDKEGDTISGKYLSKKVVTTVNGDSNKYVIKTEDGPKEIWGTTALDMSMEQVEQGSLVKIVYQGMKRSPKSNRNFRSFDIYTKQAKPTSEEVADDVPF